MASRVIKPIDFGFYCVLLMLAGHRGIVEGVGLRTLSGMVGKAPSTSLDLRIRRLETAGVIEVDRGNRHRPNVYTIVDPFPPEVRELHRNENAVREAAETRESL